MSVAPITPGGWMPSPDGIRHTEAAKTGEAPFANLIGRLLEGTVAQEAQADQAVQSLALGRDDQLHNIMLSVAKADLNFRMILEVRNRLTDAYQEIMRMQF
jgi:flagellar hook-basal body complex protein FliE